MRLFCLNIPLVWFLTSFSHMSLYPHKSLHPSFLLFSPVCSQGDFSQILHGECDKLHSLQAAQTLLTKSGTTFSLHPLEGWLLEGPDRGCAERGGSSGRVKRVGILLNLTSSPSCQKKHAAGRFWFSWSKLTKLQERFCFEFCFVCMRL